MSNLQTINLANSSLKIDKPPLFYIVNLRYGAYLYLQAGKDAYRDRIAWIRQGYREIPEQCFHWELQQLDPVYFLLKNTTKERGGTLFLIADVDNHRDHLVEGYIGDPSDKDDLYIQFSRVAVTYGSSVFHIKSKNECYLKGDDRLVGNDREVWGQPFKPNANDTRFHWLFVPAPDKF
ncbi:hypothetical protein [Photorhabdus sp. CRCIA-P01]|uniref:hypothetical protein n=1 Tax=Photorhabdus sp. CRCIA-P01 TaxID=2019570 RepID=UPI000E59E0BD|nr:hypothetical protein [Photorhabdus sp. CRCIA-P01]